MHNYIDDVCLIYANITYIQYSILQIVINLFLFIQVFQMSFMSIIIQSFSPLVGYVQKEN